MGLLDKLKKEKFTIHIFESSAHALAHKKNMEAKGCEIEYPVPGYPDTVIKDLLVKKRNN